MNAPDRLMLQMNRFTGAPRDKVFGAIPERRARACTHGPSPQLHRDPALTQDHPLRTDHIANEEAA